LRKGDEKTVMTARNPRGKSPEILRGTLTETPQLEPSELGLPMEDRNALDHLFSATYEELRRLASSVRRGDPSATLNPTALVNEAWMKMAKSPEIAATSRLHFKRIAARAMRQILIEAARRRNAGKRGGGQDVTVSFDDSYQKAPSCGDDLLRLDRALDELARMNPRQSALVESRFFGGLDIPETATLLSVSEATVLRDWRAAKAWLAHALREAS
jgi:RNA polymerase sigma factor (TIGR02999 family)